MRIIATLRNAAVAALIALAAGTALAAEESVGDIQSELVVLGRQIQEIRTALVATGGASGLSQEPATALQRVDQLEQRLREITNRVDVLANDLDRVVKDASNRVEDIEFRLTELEGGDVSLLGQGEPLGGGLTEKAQPAEPVIPPVAAITGPDAAAPALPTLPPVISPQTVVPNAAPEAVPQLAVGEQADFDAAKAAFEAGKHDEAVKLLDAFVLAYPVGPLSTEAQAMKGDALAAKGDWRAAARTYLDTFSGAPDAPTAPRALHGLAVSLGRLGQTNEACLTLAEVNIRYPGSAVASDVATTRANIGCR